MLPSRKWTLCGKKRKKQLIIENGQWKIKIRTTDFTQSSEWMKKQTHHVSFGMQFSVSKK
jgi:hypothetical protein